MSAVPVITPTGQKIWTNRHETFKQSIDELFDIFNADTGNVADDYNATTKAIMDLIKNAINQKKQIRALGAGWSFSEIATTDGWMLNTKNLNLLFNVSEASIANQYAGDKKQLLFAQCGVSVLGLNQFLRDNNRSLKTSGASNGQTIAGAFSTGTHGSAFDFGATPEFVVGIHLITGSNSHIWLERKSYPVVSQTFIDNIGTTLVQDDDLFNAALVSFGSFGFIHGAMIETADLYLLECTREKLPYNSAVKYCMQNLDFTNSPLPYGSERPWHFQVVVNPYDKKQEAYVISMYKRPYTDNYTPPVLHPNIAGPGDDAPVFIGMLTDFIPQTVPLVVNNLLTLSYPTQKWTGTSGEIFYNTATRGKVLSTAIGIPIESVGQVNDMLFELNDSAAPFPGLFAYRFVKKSQATLAFTRFDHTCVVELDGVESELTRDFYNKVWDTLLIRNIPHTFHWGKMSNLNDSDVRTLYGNDRNKWVAARNKILPKESLPIFNTPDLKNLGLDEILT